MTQTNDLPERVVQLLEEIKAAMGAIQADRTAIYTEAEAARLLGIPETSLRGLALKNEIAYCAITKNQRRYRRQDIDQYLEDRLQPTEKDVAAAAATNRSRRIMQELYGYRNRKS